MQSITMKPILRGLPRSAAPSRVLRQAPRRSFASEAPGDVSKSDSTRSVPSNPAGGNSRLPFIIGGGLLFIMVAGRYILASDKPFRSEQVAQQEARNQGVMSHEPRDTGVKTLEQKKQREQSS